MSSIPKKPLLIDPNLKKCCNYIGFEIKKKFIFFFLKILNNDFLRMMRGSLEDTIDQSFQMSE